MRWIVESVVIFLTFAVFMLGVAWWQGRGELERVRKLAARDAGAGDDTLYRKPQLSPGPPGAASPRGAWPPLPRAGRLELEGPFDLPGVLASMTYVCNRCGLPQRACICPQGPQNPWPLAGPYGPFPVDTGPLLILSEQAAANVALEREIRQRCAEAEAKIPPRWR